MKRKICSLLLAAILLTPIVFLNSAFASAPPLTELSFAYFQADAAYMTVGEKITWQIMLPSNSSSYTF